MSELPDASAERLAESYAEVLSRPWPDLPGADAPAGGESGPTLAPARIVEAMLFVGGAPLTAARAGEAARGLTPTLFTQIIDGLNRDYRRQGRPYRVRPRGQGYELALMPRFRGVLDRLYGSAREARLSPAALDVLALAAYRQPVTKDEIDSLRGAESGPPLRQLVRLGLVAVERGEAGRPEACYRTTPRFLSVFRLRNLDDLPRTRDLHRL